MSISVTAKSLARRTPLYGWYKSREQDRAYRQWIQTGRPVPPPHKVKQEAVIHYAAEFGVRTFVETGTCFGDMVNAVADVFDRLYSIELGQDLYRLAKGRFAGRDKITILQGDSGVVLGGLLKQIDASCLFWLDGHYSGGVTAKGSACTPIQRELQHVVDHPAWQSHVILIDDARCFTGQDDYPRLKTVEDWARSVGYAVCEVKDDIIRIHNKAPAKG